MLYLITYWIKNDDVEQGIALKKRSIDDWKRLNRQNLFRSFFTIFLKLIMSGIEFFISVNKSF